MLAEIFLNHNPLVMLPSDWNPTKPIPTVPNPVTEIPIEYKDWIDRHLGYTNKKGKFIKGSWYSGGRKGT